MYVCVCNACVRACIMYVCVYNACVRACIMYVCVCNACVRACIMYVRAPTKRRPKRRREAGIKADDVTRGVYHRQGVAGGAGGDK